MERGAIRLEMPAGTRHDAAVDQAFAGLFIHHRQHLDGSPILGAVHQMPAHRSHTDVTSLRRTPVPISTL